VHLTALSRWSSSSGRGPSWSSLDILRCRNGPGPVRRWTDQVDLQMASRNFLRVTRSEHEAVPPGVQSCRDIHLRWFVRPAQHPAATCRGLCRASDDGRHAVAPMYCRIGLFRIKRRASAADRDRSRSACWRPPAGIGRRGGPHPQRGVQRAASGGGAQASRMVAIPTTVDPGRAEQTCPAVTRSFGRGALHLVTAGQARSTVCGSTADGMARRRAGGRRPAEYWNSRAAGRHAVGSWS
jgi:hypothetical protein